MDEGRGEAVDGGALVVADGRVHRYIRAKVPANTMVIKTQASPTVFLKL